MGQQQRVSKRNLFFKHFKRTFLNYYSLHLQCANLKGMFSAFPITHKSASDHVPIEPLLEQVPKRDFADVKTLKKDDFLGHQKLPEKGKVIYYKHFVVRITIYHRMAAANAHSYLVQGDFGSLELPAEPADMSLEHVVDHPALSRKGSENSLMDLCCECEGACDPDRDIADQLEELLKMSSRSRRARATPSPDATMRLPLEQTTVETVLPPPRRYPRRFWSGLVRRLSQLKRTSMYCDFIFRLSVEA